MRRFVATFAVVFGLGLLTQGCVTTAWVGSWSTGDPPEQRWTLVDDVSLHGARLGWVRVDFPDEPAEHFSVLIPGCEPLQIFERPETPAMGYLLGTILFGGSPGSYQLSSGSAGLNVPLLGTDPGLGWKLSTGACYLPAIAIDTATFPVQLVINLLVLS